jgi:hypothetical protein
MLARHIAKTGETRNDYRISVETWTIFNLEAEKEFEIIIKADLWMTDLCMDIA